MTNWIVLFIAVVRHRASSRNYPRISLHRIPIHKDKKFRRYLRQRNKIPALVKKIANDDGSGTELVPRPLKEKSSSAKSPPLLPFMLRISISTSDAAPEFQKKENLYHTAVTEGAFVVPISLPLNRTLICAGSNAYQEEIYPSNT